MTRQEAIRALRAIRMYCQPEQVAAVDYAIAALLACPEEPEEMRG